MHSPLKQRKRKAYRFGLWAEWLAVLYYLLRGYLPVARRFKTRMGEIDLIFVRGRTVLFVEVKARRQMASYVPLSSAQMHRVRRAAMLFVAKRAGLAHHAQRIEVLLVAPWRWPIRITEEGV